MMKKSLIALAAVAAVGAASAQSTVTLSGLYQFAYQRDLTQTVGNKSFAPTAAQATDNTAAAVAANGKGFGVTDANFKLAAVEDLGGGLKASFDMLLETGAFRGTAVTRADSGIGLSGGFGSFAMRNTRSSDLIATIGSSAVNLADGIYDSSNIVSRIAIDTVGYTSNEIIPGLRASLTFVEGNDGLISTPATNKSTYVAGLSYTAGPLAVAGVYKSKAKDAAAVSGVTSKANVELAVSYDLGVAKVAYAYDGASAEGTGTSAAVAATTEAANGFSVTVPMGAVTLGANYFKRADFKVTEVGAAYALSKRTTLGASVGKHTADQTATITGNQYRVRLAHSF